MAEEKLVELVQKVERKTAVGGLQWEETAGHEEFQTTLATFVIRIRQEMNSQGFDYIISVVDSSGTTLESVSDGELSRIARSSETLYSVNPYELMEKIFKNAKRQVLGVDRAIDSILSELD